MSNLILITTGYPTGLETESSFIRPEIGELAKAFDKVIIAPRIDYGGSAEVLPEGVEIDRSFAGMPKGKDKARALLSPELWRDLLADLPQIRSASDFRSSMAASSGKLLFRRRLAELIRRHGLLVGDTTVYTFWFDFATEAASSIRGLRSVVTRAHRYDLYEDESFISRAARRRTLSRLTGAYVCSRSGADYLTDLFPDYAGKIHAAYLGTSECELCHADGSCESEKSLREEMPEKVTLFCCARLERVKRVPEQLGYVCDWALRNPGVRVKWIHAGDGVERCRLEEASRKLPENVEVEILGEVGNEKVHALLGSGKIDAMLLTSRSEGLPVVLMEAMSHGVSVLATNVGGVSEIVDESTGVLLPPDFTTLQFADALDNLLAHRKAKGLGARKKWESGFDASKLRKEFAEILRSPNFKEHALRK